MQTFFTIFAVARNHDDEYLVLQRAAHRSSPGKWNFVTGFVQERESAEEAALRELKEETNLSGKVAKVSEPFWDDKDGVRWVVVAVLVDVENEDDLQIDSQESQAHKWITVDDAIVSEVVELRVGFQELELSKPKLSV